MYVSSLTCFPVSGKYLEEVRMWVAAAPEEYPKFKDIVADATKDRPFEYIMGQGSGVEVHTYSCKGSLFSSDQTIQYTLRTFPDKLEIHLACVLPDEKLVCILKGFLKLNTDFESHAKKTLDSIAELYPELAIQKA